MQSYSIARAPMFLATIDQIGQKLQRGEIQTWYISKPGAEIIFVAKRGELYVIKAKYDQQTNQIIPIIS